MDAAGGRLARARSCPATLLGSFLSEEGAPSRLLLLSSARKIPLAPRAVRLMALSSPAPHPHPVPLGLGEPAECSRTSSCGRP